MENLDRGLSNVQVRSRGHYVLTANRSASFFSNVFFVRLLGMFFRGALWNGVGYYGGVVPVLYYFCVLFSYVVFVRVAVLSTVYPHRGVVVDALGSGYSCVSKVHGACRVAYRHVV